MHPFTTVIHLWHRGLKEYCQKQIITPEKKRYGNGCMKGNEIGKYRAAKIFHDHAEEYDSWFGRRSLVYETEIRALKSLHGERGEPKMEIGVGPGRFARELGVAFGFDPALAPLKKAYQRNIKCCQAVGEHLPVRDGIIGTIYILFTLCFTADPQKILWECSRVLKDDGCLVIGMTPSESKWGKSSAAKKRAGHLFYKHASFYSIKTLRSWLASANMIITEYRSTLYQVPECVELVETPGEVLDEQAGFAVIVARKG
jgi:ubiquinone/menaquinone biosynthesis C-methylase UbiE